MYNGILDHFGLEKNNVKTRIPERIEKYRLRIDEDDANLAARSAAFRLSNHGEIMQL